MKSKINDKLFIFTGILTCLLLIGVVTVLIVDDHVDTLVKSIVSIFMVLLILTNISFSFLMRKGMKTRREAIKKSFDFYVENMVSHSGIGLISFGDSGEILWVSDFIVERYGEELIGQTLKILPGDFYDKYITGKPIFRFQSDGAIYEANVNSFNKSITLKDVTIEESVLREYRNQRLVIFELEIDNYQQLQSSLTEDELFSIQSVLIKSLDKLSGISNAFYRQYVNGKYFILTNAETLKNMEENNFSILEEIRGKASVRQRMITVSIGVGVGEIKFNKLVELAKDGLIQAQSRGGDQVAVVKSNHKPVYYGSEVEISKSVSRVRIKQLTDSVHSVLKKPTIKKIIIYGHIWADLDAIGAALGVVEFAKTFNKEIYIQNMKIDNTTSQAIKELLPAAEKKMFITTEKALKLTDKNTAVFMVDTSELSRIENIKAFDNANKKYCFVIDHHRASELPKGIPSLNVYVDTSASSTCEIVVEMLAFSDKMFKPTIYTAQMLLNGIYLDTQQFRKHVSSRTFEAASWLEKHGAKSNESAARLKIPADSMRLISQIGLNAKEIRPGFFLSTVDEVVPGDVISIAADELLRAQGRRASFVIAKNADEKSYKMSARGIAVNVQQIAEKVGGGGHFEAAAAVSNESLSIFTDNVVQTIIAHKDGQKNENNNN